MIVDAHMHIGREDLLDDQSTAFLKSKGLWSEMQHRLSVEGVIEALGEAGIDKGIVFPLTFLPPQGAWQKLNDLTASYVARYPQQLVGFAIINPQEIAPSLHELERSVEELGLRGIKLHPSIQEFYPNDPSIQIVFEFAQAKGVPVLCHTGASGAGHADVFSRPMYLDEVANRYPDLRLIMAHAGRPFYAEAALLLRKYPHVYADICANIGRKGNEALMAHVLMWLQMYAGASERLIFGSDYPIFSPAATLEQFRRAVAEEWAQRWGLEPLTVQEQEQVLSGNIIGLLGKNLFLGGL